MNVGITNDILNQIWTDENCDKNGITILDLNITDRCNLKCSYCFKANSKKAKNDLPLQDWKDAYDMYKPRLVKLFGGEPTLRWNDILEFMDYIYKEKSPFIHPTKCYINSNGTTGVDYEEIPREYRDKIINCISLDCCKEIHDLSRGKGTYEKAYNSIKRSIKAGLSTPISCVLPARYIIENINIIEKFIKHIYSIGISKLMIDIIIPNPNRYNDLKKIINEDIVKAYHMLKDLDAVKYYDVDINERKVCKLDGIYISSNGNFSPKCTALISDIKYGNYKNWTLEDALRLERYRISLDIKCQDKDSTLIDRYAKGLMYKKGIII